MEFLLPGLHRCPAGDPLAQASEVLMRARDDLDGDDFAHLGGGLGPGVDGRFHRSHVAAEENRHEPAADRFVAGHGDACRLEGGVSGFEQGAEALGFDQSYCFLRHKRGMLALRLKLDAHGAQQLGVRPCDDVRADQLADAFGGLGSGSDGRIHAADVAFDDDRDESAADLDLADERDVRRLDHGVAGLDAAGVAAGFYHSDGITHDFSG